MSCWFRQKVGPTGGYTLRWPCALRPHPLSLSWPACPAWEVHCAPARWKLSLSPSTNMPAGCLQVQDAVLHDVRKKKKKAKLAAAPAPLPQKHVKEKGKAPVGTINTTTKVQFGDAMESQSTQCAMTTSLTKRGNAVCRPTTTVGAVTMGTPLTQGSAPLWRRTIGIRTLIPAAVRSMMMVSHCGLAAWAFPDVQSAMSTPASPAHERMW